MAESMTEEQLILQEWKNSGTTWTRNEQFDKDGYYVVKNLWDPKELYDPLPLIHNHRGQYSWWGKKLDQFNYQEIEAQVEGSLSRYTYPKYLKVHGGIRKKLEKIIGRDLYETYYYDRYYFLGQELTRHADRDACEISVTVHISTNLKEQWPIKIKTPDIYADKEKRELLSLGQIKEVILEPGDGMIYKGCERPHWRDRMPGILETSLAQLNQKSLDELYYHQIFFHYVLQDGERAHCAWDMSR